MNIYICFTWNNEYNTALETRLFHCVMFHVNMLCSKYHILLLWIIDHAVQGCFRCNILGLQFVWIINTPNTFNYWNYGDIVKDIFVCIISDRSRLNLIKMFHVKHPRLDISKYHTLNDVYIVLFQVIVLYWFELDVIIYSCFTWNMDERLFIVRILILLLKLSLFSCFIYIIKIIVRNIRKIE